MTTTKRLIAAVVMGLCGCLVMSMFGFGAQCEELSDRVVRLHILAASDSDADQSLKLKVRDAIIAQTEGILDGVYDTALATSILSEELSHIQQIAQACLHENGCSDTVTVALRESYFDTRVYDNATLPAGYYQALTVRIGGGEGKNWWCVVFPPMCLSGAQESSLDDVLTEQQQDIVTNPSGYTVRLKVLEWVHRIGQWFS